MAKRIMAIVALTIISLLIITTIIMGSVNTYYGASFENPNEVYVQYGSNAATKADAETADKIVSLIKDSSKQKVLTAFFTGELNKTAEVNSSTIKTMPSTSGFKVVLNYSTPQYIKVGNKIFKDGDGNSYKYAKLAFVITNTNGYVKSTAYIIEDELNPTRYTHSFVFDADYSGVYNFLVSKGFNA